MMWNIKFEKTRITCNLKSVLIEGLWKRILLVNSEGRRQMQRQRKRFFNQIT
jgi:hypothetical protein